MPHHSNRLLAFFSLLWRMITIIRQAFANLVFLLAVILFIGLYSFWNTKAVMPEYQALTLDLDGMIVEETSIDSAFQRSYQEFRRLPKIILLRDIIRVIEHAKADEKVQALILDLDYLPATSLTKLMTIARALADFKTSGKPIYAIGDQYDQGSYLLAAHADQIFLNQAGFVLLHGLSVYPSYLHSALEKASVKPYIFRTGKYKSAVEPFIRDDMSPETKAADYAWLNDLWDHYREIIAEQRNLKMEWIAPKGPELLTRLKNVDGDAAQYALEYGFVDKLMTRQQMQNVITQEVTGSENTNNFKQISFDGYLHSMGPLINSKKPNTVAVVTAEGEIRDGYHPNGVIGDGNINELLQHVIDDKDIKALVFRIESPGGSAFAAEQIRQKLLEVQQAGKPVVVSMGSIAASGGYWIAADASKIFAEPTTLTGSIGVFSMFFSIQETLKKLGIYSDGIATTDYASIDNRRHLPKTIQDIFQISVDKTYQTFLEIVANGRVMLLDKVDQVAQGRVWSGKQAQANGLVDTLGGLEDAIAYAAKMTMIDEDYGVRYIRHQLTRQQQILMELFSYARHLGIDSYFSTLVEKLTPFTDTLERFIRHPAPNHIYALCESESVKL